MRPARGAAELDLREMRGADLAKVNLGAPGVHS